MIYKISDKITVGIGTDHVIKDEREENLANAAYLESMRDERYRICRLIESWNNYEGKFSEETKKVLNGILEQVQSGSIFTDVEQQKFIKYKLRTNKRD